MKNSTNKVAHKVFEVVFRETVAYHAFVAAPSREAASLWANKHGTHFMNSQVQSQIVEERGVEELFEVNERADFSVNENGNRVRFKKNEKKRRNR